MKNICKRASVFILSLVMLFNLGMVGVQPAMAAEPAVNGVHDIFTAKDNTPLEQFKARVLNRILYLDTEIDVSDLDIAPGDIQYTVNGMDLTGIYAAREIVRQNPFYSTAATTGFPEFTYKDNGCVATVKYTYHPAWTQDFVKKVIASYDEVMAMIQPGDSDFAKILKIHDWIVKNVSYGMSTLYYDFAVGALANRKAVCAGYAQCNQFLLSQVGIESIYIAANTVKEPHAWNLVKLDGHWFHVDCTWDRGLGVNPNVNHTYFMLSDAEFNADGVHSEDWKTPAKGYPTNNLCSIENKFYKDNKDIATDAQIAANPITIKHEADPTQDYQANDREHWRTCSEGVEVGRELHTGEPCTVCGRTNANHAVNVTTDGNGTASATPSSAETGTEITLTATPNAGYHFKEWKVLSGGVTITDNKFTMPAENVEVQAVFEKDAPKTYTVTVSDDGNGTASATPTAAEEGAEIALTATPDAGYHFKEWKVVSGAVTITDNKFTMPAENVEVQAVFEKDAPKTYTVTVTTNGNGTASATPAAAEEGTEITLTATPDAGYHFKEWKVVSGGTAITNAAVTAQLGGARMLQIYTGGLTITDNKFIMPANNVEIQAVFEKDAPVTYAVTVSDDGNGTASASAATAEAGAEITLTATPNTGYHFKEWKVLSGGVTITDNKFTMPAENVEVQAIFEKDAPKTYTVTVSDDGNGTASASAATAEAGTEITLTATPNAGYHFKEWKVLSGGVTITANKFTMPAENVEVKAVFEKDAVIAEKVALTFVTNGGDAINAVTVDKGSTVDLSKYIPSRSGYTFSGWYTEAELSNKVSAITLDSDVTIYAGWAKDSAGDDNGTNKPADNQKPSTPASGNNNGSGKPNTGTSNPQTGDNTHLTIYIAVATFSLIALLLVAIFMRKRKQDK